MQIPEEIYCPECKLHSCPETKETTKGVKLICFWCEKEVKELLKWKFDFGKYKGEYVEDCKDLNYLVWLADSFQVKSSQHRILIERVKQRIEELKC